MTQLFADASETSAIWMSPGEVDQILAATWRKPPPPAVRILKSDAEVRAASLLEKSFADLLIDLAAIRGAGLGRRVRAELAAEVPSRLVTQPAVKPTLAMLDPVRAEMKKLATPISDRAETVVARLSTELSRMKVDGLPPVHASTGKEGVFLIEWTVGRRRLGINVEPKAEDSSWYYVSFDQDRVASASGPMADLDLPVLLRRLVAE